MGKDEKKSPGMEQATLPQTTVIALLHTLSPGPTELPDSSRQLSAEENLA